MSSNSVYYFAYGTLLDAAEMAKYCPTARKVEVASFADHQLEFWAYGESALRVGCHLAPSPGISAFGVVYSVTAEEIRTLDEASGVSHGWFDRRPIDVVAESGTEREVTTYFLRDPLHRKTPPKSYSGLVRSGSRSAGLPEQFVDELTGYLDRLDAEAIQAPADFDD